MASINNCIQIFSGAYIDLDNPDMSNVTIEDIAHALANQCRFNGCCKTFYSVAQHAVLASIYAPDEFKYDALMHDAAEAIVGDVTSPIKQMLPEFKAIERRVEDALFRAFGVTHPYHPEVKKVDLVMLATERRDLMTEQDTPWPVLNNIEPVPGEIVCWTPDTARSRFIARFIQLYRPAGGYHADKEPCLS